MRWSSAHSRVRSACGGGGSPRHMNRIRFHGTEERLKGLLDWRGHPREVVLDQGAGQIAQQALREAGPRRWCRPSGGCAPSPRPGGTLRAHFLIALENNDQQGRVEREIRLAHRRSERKAELFELAERLRGGAASVVADGFKRSQPRFNPARLGRRGVRCHQSAERNRARIRTRIARYRTFGVFPMVPLSPLPERTTAANTPWWIIKLSSRADKWSMT